ASSGSCSTTTSRSTWPGSIWSSPASSPRKLSWRLPASAASSARLPRPCVARQSTLPEILRFPQVLADPAAEHEKRLAQAAHVAKRPLPDRLDAGQCQEFALGATAHGAGLMQEALDPTAPGQDE